jgi:hypothetical protein
MWLALHAYRQVHVQSHTIIIQHAQEACRILTTWINGNSMEIAEVKESPKQVRAARKTMGKTASIRAVAAATRKSKAKGSKPSPATPKRPQSMYPNSTLSVVSNLRMPSASDLSRQGVLPVTPKAKTDSAATRKNSRRIVPLMSMPAFLKLRYC